MRTTISRVPVVSATRQGRAEATPVLGSAPAVGGPGRDGACASGNGLRRRPDETHRRALRGLLARLATALEEPTTARLGTIDVPGLAPLEEPPAARLGAIEVPGLPPPVRGAHIRPLESRRTRRAVLEIARSPLLAGRCFAPHPTRPRGMTGAALTPLDVAPLAPGPTELRLVARPRELATGAEVPWRHRAGRLVIEPLDGVV